MQAYGSTGNAGFSGAYGAAYGTAYGSAAGGNAFAGPLAGDALGNAFGGLAGAKRRNAGSRRMNIVAMAMAVLVPWVIFCAWFSILSFDLHYRKPDLCKTLSIITGVVLGLFMLISLGLSVRRHFFFGGPQEPSWLLFISVTALVAWGAGMAVGNRNFKVNTQPYFDITALNTYQGVDVARMRGQELMDAGRVNFVEGTRVDTGRSMGFKNFETYCVAPITISGNSVVGSPALASYDFWAVGKDCCGMPASGSVDFRCGAYDNPNALGGIRALSDEDRAFYRLAVQQAQSAYSIRSVHPLFFHWVADPTREANSYLQAAHQVCLSGIFIYFGFQLFLVYAAVTCFQMLGLSS